MSTLSVITATLLAIALQAPAPDVLARAASEEFARAQFTPLIARFNAQMKAAATEPILQAALKQLTDKIGAFSQADGTTACKEAAAMRVCITPLLFTRAHVALQIAVDGEGLIAGLVIAGVTPLEK